MELVLGLRGSKLSIVQGESVQKLLARSGIASRLKIIKTTGDRRSEGAAIVAAKDKKEWVAEIEEALEKGEIDLAVHSGKDVPVDVRPGTVVEPVRNIASRSDVLIASERIDSLDQIKPGFRIGTSSDRRRCQLERTLDSPDILPIRGNIDTRLAKMKSGNLDGIVLARAGLERLEIGLENSVELPFDTAVAQGILAVQFREGENQNYLPALFEETTRQVFHAERSFIEKIGADCHSAVGVRAEVQSNRLRLRCDVFQSGGKKFFKGEIEGAASEVMDVVESLAEEVFSALGRNLFGGGRVS